MSEERISNHQRIEFDLDQTFMLYATFCGDIAKTAHSTGLSREKIEQLATEHGWADKISEIIELNKGSKPGDMERGINRALNFVQANRFRIWVEKLMRAMVNAGDLVQDDLDVLRQKRYNKQGEITSEIVSTRALADLAATLEKIHWMTYEALGDSPQERAKRIEKPADDSSQTDTHARIAAALAKMRTNHAASQLQDAQAAMVEELKKPVKADIPPSVT
jgi:hypothetical protein